MALVHLLRARFPDKDLYAYTIDHALREDSAREAQRVHDWLSPLMTHRIIRWDAAKPASGIQEAAREARYRLLGDAARADGASVICLAHHRDDQAETILHRLAKGSGLDGLAAMRPVVALDAQINLVRPLLSCAHDDLVAHCRERGVAWIEDPSNDNPLFARVRLRHARAALEEEGLTNDRLAKLAERMRRAREALDFYTNEALRDHGGVTAQARETLPPEIILRMTLKLADGLVPGHMLRSRLGQLEEWLEDRAPRRVTLGRTILTFREDGSVNLEAETIA